jgi:hypothetical protein
MANPVKLTSSVVDYQRNGQFVEMAIFTLQFPFLYFFHRCHLTTLLLNQFGTAWAHVIEEIAICRIRCREDDYWMVKPRFWKYWFGLCRDLQDVKPKDAVSDVKSRIYVPVYQGYLECVSAHDTLKLLYTLERAGRKTN